MSLTYEPFAFEVEGDIHSLARRLKKGMLLQTRIVLCLDNNRYLLRIYGHNLVMESRLPFKRFDEITVKVTAVHPRLQLSVMPVNQPSADNRTDLLVY